MKRLVILSIIVLILVVWQLIRARRRRQPGEIQLSLTWRILMSSSLTLKDSQKVVLTAKGLDAKGFAASDTYTWSIADASVASFGGSSTATGATVTLFAGAPGTTDVTLTDAENNSVTLTVTVSAGSDASLDITVGEISEQ